MTVRYRFFLGGRDLEMTEIARLVRNVVGAGAVVDSGLPWHGAAASAYASQIDDALSDGMTPVLVELKPDLPAAVLSRCVVLDHHGTRAGRDRQTALEQVFALLDLPRECWTRRLALVAANDRGWIPELRRGGARPAEIAALRAEDRAAQGITAADESASEAALEKRECHLDGKLLLVRQPHARTAAVFDRLALESGDADPPDTLVVSPQELNFSGRGPAVAALAAAFPGGWYGGALPERGFWGHGQPPPDVIDVLAVLAEALADRPASAPRVDVQGTSSQG